MASDFTVDGSPRRMRDWWLLPNLVSVLRVPLALAFPYVSREPRLALIVLITGAATDLVDGFLARRLRQTTALGAVLDGTVDKFFAAVVAGTLLFQQRLSLWEAGLLFVRELLELPLVLWCALDRTQRQSKLRRSQANWLGKLATVLQFFSLGAVLTSSPLRGTWIAIAGSCGALAGRPPTGAASSAAGAGRGWTLPELPSEGSRVRDLATARRDPAREARAPPYRARAVAVDQPARFGGARSSSRRGDSVQSSTLRPMRYPAFFEMCRAAIKNTWTVEEVDFSTDVSDLRARMTVSERHLIERLVAVFATGDSIVADNLVLNLYKHINAPEARPVPVAPAV